MIFEKILPFAHTLLTKSLSAGSIAIDATIGNGHDTAFLATLVGDDGHVFGFDIQQEALDNTKERLASAHLLERVTLFRKGHEHIKETIPLPFHQKVQAAIFNLGYLPGSDKKIVTQPETTIAAINQLLDIMAPNGVIVLVIYHGHKEGKVERDALLRYTQTIDQQLAQVLKYEFINQKNNPPFIIAIEKK